MYYFLRRKEKKQTIIQWSIIGVCALSLAIALAVLASYRTKIELDPSVYAPEDTKDNPKDHTNDTRDDHKKDEDDEPAKSKRELLYESPIVDNPTPDTDDYLEGKFRMYNDHLKSDPLIRFYYVELELADSSVLIDYDSSFRYGLCFTDNLYLLESDLKNGANPYLTHPSRPTLTGDDAKAMVTTFVADDGIIMTVSKHTACVFDNGSNDNAFFSTTLSLPISSSFDPDLYGAAAIVRTPSSVDSSNIAGVTFEPHSLGNFFYAHSSQRSMHPTLKTVLMSTSDDYTISGTIHVRGHVQRDPSSGSDGYELIDVPSFRFAKIDMSSQPPALVLYLTTRSEWTTFDKDTDFYIEMEDDVTIHKGTYTIAWPLEKTVDIQDYIPGFFFLRDETLAETLAGGAIEVMKEY